MTDEEKAMHQADIDARASAYAGLPASAPLVAPGPMTPGPSECYNERITKLLESQFREIDNELRRQARVKNDIIGRLIAIERRFKSFEDAMDAFCS